ncbi:MAG: TolC family protein [Verrucomicrobiota bacterium]
MKSHFLGSVAVSFATSLLSGLIGCASRPAAEHPANIDTCVPGASNNSSAAFAKKEFSVMKEPVGVLILRDALSLTLQENPELAPFSWQERIDEARVLQAGLRQNPELGLEVEDVFGTGNFRGAREMQTTLQLSQVIELGGKRSARTDAATQARGVTKSDYELKRVEVLGDVAQRFIQVVADQHALDLTLTNRDLAVETLRIVQERMKAGKGSALEERKAQVALARGEVLVEGEKHKLRGSRKKLSISWRNPNPVFERAEADLFALKPIPAFEELVNRISKSPQLARFISEKKLREAEIKLADARRIPDITVGGGVRRLNGPDDHALVFSISAPLQLFDQNQGRRAEARALLGKTEAEQKAAEIRVGVVLAGLYEEMARDIHVLEGLQKQILPKAEDALAIAKDGYTQGRFSYLEVLDAQRTLFDIKQESIQTATSYHQFLVEMERLIGQPIDEKAQP